MGAGPLPFYTIISGVPFAERLVAPFTAEIHGEERSSISGMATIHCDTRRCVRHVSIVLSVAIKRKPDRIAAHR